MYVIYVASGREDDIMKRLRLAGYAAYVPKRIIIQRKNGIYYSIPQILFSGYVFIDVKKISPEAYYKIRGLKGVGYFLSRDNPLPEAEAAYIRELYENGEIGISKGFLENGKLKITEGFLKRRENRIVKYSVRQRRATVELTIYGKPHRIVCGVEIEKKHEETALVDSLPALCRNVDNC